MPSFEFVDHTLSAEGRRWNLELLQDLVLAAVNEAGRKIENEIQRITQGMAGGMGIPGFPGLT